MYDSNDPEVKYTLRFGEIAIQKGFITISALEEALAEQISIEPSVKHKQWKVVGQILFDKGYMTINQIEIVMEEIDRNKDQQF